VVDEASRGTAARAEAASRATCDCAPRAQPGMGTLRRRIRRGPLRLHGFFLPPIARSAAIVVLAFSPGPARDHRDQHLRHSTLGRIAPPDLVGLQFLGAGIGRDARAHAGSYMFTALARNHRPCTGVRSETSCSARVAGKKAPAGSRLFAAVTIRRSSRGGPEREVALRRIVRVFGEIARYRMRGLTSSLSAVDRQTVATCTPPECYAVAS